MFGYISINKSEMKFKDFDLYHSFYCGLCAVLQKNYGKRGQLTLSFDMTFLEVLLTALYEPETEVSSRKCIAHPFEKHETRINEYTEYVAAMNIILSYYKCEDDWNDEKKYTKFLYAKLLEGKSRDIRARYEKKIQVIVRALNDISEGERQEEENIDKMAGYFGEVMGQIFLCREDEWQENLYRMGFFLGKFIYIMDAYEDIEEDIKKKNYNPFSKIYQEPGFEDRIEKVLTMMMAECSKEFEKLPIIEYTDILRNVLYSGVWCKYAQTRLKRDGGGEAQNEGSGDKNR
ncbi:DUF5685 family protein [Hespellia stercorisuis]|uniref:Uncharacterized protein n=1 Tax=Hespellia stercorisuis DSM 15480 TaxID=1121950 RepID=A0A1M6UXB2_9FIRM|nr:DUF5685 family protein [Hespellia stercorisuis]SHK73791.1 hypothetical protein SAMN02745243_03630 [Hespellia stercorisuis DSM 15480]